MFCRQKFVDLACFQQLLWQSIYLWSRFTSKNTKHSLVPVAHIWSFVAGCCGKSGPKCNVPLRVCLQHFLYIFQVSKLSKITAFKKYFLPLLSILDIEQCLIPPWSHAVSSNWNLWTCCSNDHMNKKTVFPSLVG